MHYRGPFPQTPEAPGGDEHADNLDKSSPIDAPSGGGDNNQGGGAKEGGAEGNGKGKGQERPLKEAGDQADQEKEIGGPEAGKASGSAQVNPFPSDTLEGAPHPPSSSSSAEDAKEGGGGEPELGRCNIWVGDSKRQEESARMDVVDEDEVVQRDGPALVYVPVRLPPLSRSLSQDADAAVKLVPGEGLENPCEVWSTWRFNYEPDETEKLMKLSEVRSPCSASVSPGYQP